MSVDRPRAGETVLPQDAVETEDLSPTLAATVDQVRDLTRRVEVLEVRPAPAADAIPAAGQLLRGGVVLITAAVVIYLWMTTEPAARGEHLGWYLATLVVVALIALGADELVRAVLQAWQAGRSKGT